MYCFGHHSNETPHSESSFCRVWKFQVCIAWPHEVAPLHHLRIGAAFVSQRLHEISCKRMQVCEENASEQYDICPYHCNAPAAWCVWNVMVTTMLLHLGVGAVFVFQRLYDVSCNSAACVPGEGEWAMRFSPVSFRHKEQHMLACCIYTPFGCWNAAQSRIFGQFKWWRNWNEYLPIFRSFSSSSFRPNVRLMRPLLC